MLSTFSGSRGPHGPDLPLPFRGKFHFPCSGEAERTQSNLTLTGRLAPASTTRLGEAWVQSIKIPRFLAILGGWTYLLRGCGSAGAPLGVEFSFLASCFLHIHKQKKIIKEYHRMSMSRHSLQVTSF